jgi:hypothetical protein
MRRIIRSFLLAVSLAAVVAAAGCSDSDPETGVVAVHLSDAPYPFHLIASAEVTLEALEAHVRGEGDAEFRVLDETPRTIDLLELRNGVTELLVEAPVPAGFVDQLRLRIGNARVTLTDGRQFDLETPSGASSGIKVFLEPQAEVAAGLTTELLLDFDVSESFRCIPAAPNRPEDITEFQFHPTLRAANLAETGTIAGRVMGNGGTPLDTSDDEPVVDATVRVLLEGQVLTTVTDADGEFRVMGVPAGAKTVVVSAAGHVEASLAVTIVAGSEVSVGALVLAETPLGP